MTNAQNAVLLALNMRQMQAADAAWLGEYGVPTEYIATACGRSNRSTATVLSQMRDFRWVASCHGSYRIGWLLTAQGVAALEGERAASPEMHETPERS